MIPRGYGQLLLAIVIFVVISEIQADREYRKVCYFTNWSRWRRGIGKFGPANVDPFLCTHIVFAFGNFDYNGNVTPFEAGYDETDYHALVQKKEQNEDLKILLALGGWNFGSQKFSTMAGSTTIRANFISSVVRFMRDYGFDGLDIDWEYPTARGGKPEDKHNLVTLCRELVEAFTSDAESRDTDRLLLTAAVPANPETARNGYDVPSLSRYFDFVNLMTYDFHGGWDHKTGFNSPLYAAPNDDNPSFNMDSAARWWHEAGMPKHKIIVGLATYGRSFSLNNPSDHGVGAAASTGPAGPVTRGQGFWSYYEICLEIKRGGGQVVFDEIQKVPYYVKGSLWIGYDDERSLQIKAEWLKSNNYGGVMFWALDLDDFNQVCTPTSTRKYPLIRTVTDILDDDDSGEDHHTSTSVSEISTTARTTGRLTERTTGRMTRPTSVTTSSRTTSTTTPTEITTRTTSNPNNRPGSAERFTCDGKTAGMYADPADCSKFYWCLDWAKYRMSCPPTLVWDTTSSVCNYPDLVDTSQCVLRE